MNPMRRIVITSGDKTKCLVVTEPPFPEVGDELKDGAASWRVVGIEDTQGVVLPTEKKTGVKPISEWGGSCGRGFVRDARFGPGQVIKGTNRAQQRARNKGKKP